jgi:flagellar basal body-associated protein FliL
VNSRQVGVLAQILLSVIFTVGYMLVVYLFMTGKAHVAGDIKDVFVTIIGVLTAGELTIINFWFSSSRSSQDKDNIIAAAAIK